MKYLPGAIFNLRIDLIILRGKVRGQDGSVDLLYVGRGQNLAYLKKSILTESTVIEAQKTSLFAVTSKIARWETKADIVFIDIGWPYNGMIKKSGAYLEVPDWISMIVPIEKDWAAIEQRFNKTTRKQIRRMDYQFEATQDPDVIARFYDDFYLPFVSQRHDGDVILDSRSWIETRARKGKVLRVLSGGEAVVSGVVYFEEDMLFFLWVGMAEKYLSDPPPAAILSIYYYCLLYAFENGYGAANWMGTRGFPTDGVFQFKRRWGACVDDSFSRDSSLIKPARNSVMAAKFLEAIPLLTRRNGSIQQIFCTTAPTCGDKEIERMMSQYSCGGIDRIKVVHLVEGATDIGDKMYNQDENVTVRTTKLENFSASVLDD